MLFSVVVVGSLLAVPAASASASAAVPPADWSQLSPAHSPPARNGASMAYDPGTGQLVLFGGLASSGGVLVLGDTWVWDGSDWSQLSPAHSPQARGDASMAYDPGSGQLVLFGGLGTHNLLGDTWVWDGADWSALSPAHSPPARGDASMAYDPGSGQLVLFGGNASSGVLVLGDTWVWDGSDWSQQSPVHSPPAREFASMAHDPGSGQLVLFGGDGGSGPLGDTWVWDGADWSALRPVHSPPARAVAAMAYDPGTGQLVLFGGQGDSGRLGDTWVYGPSQSAAVDWSQLSPTHSPARGFAVMTDDPGTGQLVRFGGTDAGPLLGDTWVWDGSDWSQLSPAHRPPVRSDASMGYDPGTAQLVLFGGFGDGALLGDTWVWDGSDWSQLSPAHSPPAREGASMGYDPGTGQLVLFGGFGDGARFGDTWVWTGSDWSQLSPPHSPSARDFASMAYDSGSGQLLLFGGDGDGGRLADTWVWDGSDWSALSPADNPPARDFAAMAYDPGMGQLVMFGGSAASGILGDSWVWDGSDWSQLSPTHRPPVRYAASMADDPGTGQLVLSGGLGNGFLGDTWIYGRFLTSQAIMFTSTPPVSPAIGGSYPVSATGGASGNPVVFSIDAATTNAACSLNPDGFTVSFDHAGSCVIDADQAGDGVYSAAPTVQQAVVVAKTAQAISFDSTPPVSPTIGGSYPVSASGGGSGNPVTFSVDASTTNSACSVSGSTVSFDHAGLCVIDADQAGNSDYTAAPRMQQSVPVGPSATTTVVSVSSSAITATVSAVAPGAPSPTGTVTFTVDGSTVGTAPLDNGVATLATHVATGKVQHVAASYPGDNDFTGSSDSTARHDPKITVHLTSRVAKTRFGWYRRPVTAHFSCTTNGSPLVGGCPKPVRLSHSAAGQSLTRTITAVNGGAATATVTGINIDQRAPRVRAGGIHDGVTYHTMPLPRLSCLARDPLSGVASCHISTHTSGLLTRYTLRATDRAGNTTTVHGHYRIARLIVTGVPYRRGAYTVHRAHRYLITVTAATQPRYYEATPVGSVPFKPGPKLKAAGHHRWTLTVTITPRMRHYRYWNVGVKIHHHLTVERLRVLA